MHFKVKTKIQVLFKLYVKTESDTVNSNPIRSKERPLKTEGTGVRQIRNVTRRQKKVARGKGPRDPALPSAVTSPANANKRQTQTQRASSGPGAGSPSRPQPRQKAATRVAAASETPGRGSRTLHLRDGMGDKTRQEKAASPHRQRPAELPHGGRCVSFPPRLKPSR